MSDQVDLLRDQINQLERSLNRRLDQQDRQLQDIKQQTTLTNSRVTKLENVRSHAEGVVSAFRWLPTVLAGGLSTGLTIVLMALTGNLH